MEIGNVEISDFFVPLFSWRTIIEHVISDNVVPEGGNIEMQLLVHITNHEECVTPIMEKMMEAGIHLQRYVMTGRKKTVDFMHIIFQTEVCQMPEITE